MKTATNAPVRICIYAFASSSLFFRALIDLCKQRSDEIEWSVICPRGHFRHVFHHIVPAERFCYLFERFDHYYQAADERAIQAALECGNGLVRALLSDKLGYSLIDKQEQLRRGAAMYLCYREFLERVRPDYVLFPILEEVDGFMLMNLCHDLNIGVLYTSSLRLLGMTYFSVDVNETLPPYYGSYDDTDVRTARALIEKFYRRTPAVLGGNYPSNPPPKPSWFRRLIVSEYLRWRYERLHRSQERQYTRVIRNFFPLMEKLRRVFFEMTSSRHFDIRSDLDRLPDRYVFYAMHHTPEASINAIEPYYADQMRAIDALLMGLPKGYRLLVKEHPTMYGRRRLSFYRCLRKRAGVVMVHPKVDTRLLIAGSAVVATVSGTIGLEAYLLDRPAVLLGRTYFNHLCHSTPAPRDMPAFLERVVSSYKPASAKEKEIEFAKFVNIGGDFVIEDPWYYRSMMAPANIRATRDYLIRHLERLKSAGNVPVPGLSRVS